MSVYCSACPDAGRKPVLVSDDDGRVCASCRDEGRDGPDPLAPAVNPRPKPGPSPLVETALMDQLRMGRELQKRLKRKVFDRDKRGNDAAFDPRLAGEFHKLTRTITDLSKEVRIFQDDEKSRVGKMTQEERMHLAVDTVRDMPLEIRRQALALLEESVRAGDVARGHYDRRVHGGGAATS